MESFAIPLVRLDSNRIQRIRRFLPITTLSTTTIARSFLWIRLSAIESIELI